MPEIISGLKSLFSTGLLSNPARDGVEVAESFCEVLASESNENMLCERFEGLN